ncbi:transposase, partial [Variovorax sp. GB1P17]|uniref:transposase n=1 Tax=Variovorax sp. GB1P17 TaxID=3443740 RepID=UPI003F476670
MSKPPRAKYRTTNWSEYNAALKRRGSFMVWLAADLQWQALASSRSGRPAVFSDAAIQFCLTLKFMFGLALRQATGLAESLLKLAHLDWAVPDYSTLSRRQKTLSVAIATRRSSAGLHLLIVSGWALHLDGPDQRLPLLQSQVSGCQRCGRRSSIRLFRC